MQLPDGELALPQNRQHFPAHVARGADDGDAIAHGSDPERSCAAHLCGRACNCSRLSCPSKTWAATHDLKWAARPVPHRPHWRAILLGRSALLLRATTEPPVT